MAGGTGSGVGAYCTECLRSEYPRSCIVNPVVWPYASGEVILQNYNAILTLAKLYEYSNALILFENDQLHEICSRIDSKKVSFDDLNTLLTHKLATILQPAYKSESSATLNHLDEIVTDVCAQNDYKLLTVNNVPQLHNNSIEYNSYQWPPLYKHLKQMLVTGWFMDESLPYTSTQTCRNRSIAMSLFSRGLNNHTDLLNEYFPKTDRSLFVDWNSFNVSLWNQKREFNKYNKCLTLLSNSQAPISKIDKLVQKAWKMFTSKAYVHQYLKYGFEEDTFLNSFLSVEQTIKHYNTI